MPVIKSVHAFLLAYSLVTKAQASVHHFSTLFVQASRGGLNTLVSGVASL